RPGRVRVPAGRPLAAEERQEGQPMVAVAALGRWGERVLEPDVEVAAVRERSALDDAAAVQPVQEEPRPRLRPLGLAEDAQRAGGADVQRGASARAARAEVRADPVDPDGDVLQVRQAFLVDVERREQLLVPAAGREIEEAGAGRERRARDRLAAEVV